MAAVHWIAGIVVFMGVSACDGGSDDTGDDTGDDTSDDTGDTGTTFNFPQTATMAAGIGGTTIQAHLCEYQALGGGTEISLGPGGTSVCMGGTELLTFTRDTGTGAYTAGDGVLTSTHGTLTSGTATALPADTDITVTTDRLEVDFTFTGNDVTVDALVDNGS